MKNGKPIFEEERLFLSEKLGINIPIDCWRDGSKIYLDCTCDKPLYTFRVKNKQMSLTKDNSVLFENYEQKKLDDLIQIYDKEINEKEEESVKFLVNYLIKNNDYEKIIVAHSSGKDSVVSFNIFKLALEKIKSIDINIYNRINNIWITNFANTTNDTGYTYKFIKKVERINIMNPDKGLINWIKEDCNYRHPIKMMRNCCAVYKEGQLTKHFDKNEKILMVTGVRKYESVKRSKYENIMNYNDRIRIHGISNLPKNWDNVAPIVEWKDFNVWLYIIKNNLDFNYMYKLGFHRIGCLNCPFQQDYIDILTDRYFPNSKKRWDDMLRKAYDINNIGRQLKWTEQEYVDFGKWKSGTGFEYYITNLKPTDERILELATRKGCSKEIASKFWDNTCSKCGIKLNPTEISMSLKLLGRDSNKLCKECLCSSLAITKKQYKEKIIELYNSDCKLF